MSFRTNVYLALACTLSLPLAGCATNPAPVASDGASDAASFANDGTTIDIDGETFFVASLDEVDLAQDRVEALAAPAAKDAASIGEVAIELKIAQPKSSKYRRPYVAIWIEDSGGKVVRFLTVWGPQVKYQRDMRTFWQVSKQAEEKDIDAVTRATRPPGEHKIIWDGLDNAGKPLPAGDYTIQIDVAREHGTRVSTKKSVACKTAAVTEKIAGNTEIESVVLKYAPVKAK